MLEMKDRVLLKDGCSILSTMGGRRFRVLAGGENDGYDTAQVEFLRDSVVHPDQMTGLLELHDKVSRVLLTKSWGKTFILPYRYSTRKPIS